MRSRLILLLVGVTALAACERPADTENRLRFADGPIAFDYPGNWTTKSDFRIESEGYGMVDVDSTGDATMSISIFPAPIGKSIREWAKTIESGRREEMEAMTKVGDTPVVVAGASTFEDIETRFGKEQRPGLVEKFTVTALGEDVPHFAEFHRLERRGWTLIVMGQAAAEDWKMVRPGFQLVYDTIEMTTDPPEL